MNIFYYWVKYVFTDFLFQYLTRAIVLEIFQIQLLNTVNFRKIILVLYNISDVCVTAISKNGEERRVQYL